jgi:tetratricopeptide (TPR) repeat protein
LDQILHSCVTVGALTVAGTGSKYIIAGAKKFIPRGSKEPKGTPETAKQAAKLAKKANKLLVEGEYAEAEEPARKAVELDPTNATCQSVLGAVLYQQGKYAEAEEPARKAVELDPTDAVIQNNLGTVLYQQGKYAEAEEPLRKAVELNPENGNYTRKLVEVREILTASFRSKSTAEIVGILKEISISEKDREIATLYLEVLAERLGDPAQRDETMDALEDIMDTRSPQSDVDPVIWVATNLMKDALENKSGRRTPEQKMEAERRKKALTEKITAGKTQEIESLTEAAAVEVIEKFKGDHLVLGLTSINEGVARELAKFKGSKISLKSIETLDEASARELAEFKGEIEFGDVVLTHESKEIWERVRPKSRKEIFRKALETGNLWQIEELNPQEARELAAAHNGGFLSLDGLKTLDAATAKEFAAHKGFLSLSGLETLDAATAKELAAHNGGFLSLDGLKTLDVAVAKELAAHEGTLYLGGLKTLDVAVAKELAAHKGGLSLGGLKTLDVAVAKELAAPKGSLSLDGLKTLDVAVAKELAAHNGGLLFLAGLETLNAETAKELAAHKGGLSLGGLKTMDVAVAKELAAHKGSLSLDGLETLNAETAKELAAHKGSLSLDGLETLNAETAKELAANQGTLFLNGLKTLDTATAKELAAHKGNLSLDGLKTLDAATAKELAAHKGDLFLSGLKTLDIDTAEALAQHPGARNDDFLDNVNLRNLDESSAKIWREARIKAFRTQVLQAATETGNLHDIGTITAAEAAEIIKGFKGDSINIDLKSLDPGVARELAKFQGRNIQISGCKTIDSATAKELVEFKGRTSSDFGRRSIKIFVETIDQPTAEIFAKYEGDLSLRNLDAESGTRFEEAKKAYKAEKAKI